MTDNRIEQTVLDEMAIMHELLSQSKDVKVEYLPDGTARITGTLEVPVRRDYPGYLIKGTI